MFFIGAFGIEYRLHLEIETEKEKKTVKNDYFHQKGYSVILAK